MDYEAMANEELAVRARSGDKDAERGLWENKCIPVDSNAHTALSDAMRGRWN